jgi:predicted acyltransferase
MSTAQKPDFRQQRLVSLDAYRGLIMIALAFNGFGLAQTAQLHLKQTDSAFWRAVYHQFEHAEWRGCGFWDLIQPSFMFMVGVAMAFSYARREEAGQSYLGMFLHACKRGLVLIFLGIFLISNGAPSTSWSLMNVLTQIGLGYPFLFLFRGRHWILQAAGAALILVGTWLLYTRYSPDAYDPSAGDPSAGVSAKWAQENLEGVPPAWYKNANVGHTIDVEVLNELPLKKPFVFNRGGYQSINFLPSLATMLFGLMAGELLRSGHSAGRKLTLLVGLGSLGLVAGLALDLTGVCPIVKRIWTPSWAVFSTGWCCLILASLYAIIDVGGWKAWAWPLAVVGMNSIAMYCMSMTLKSWTGRMLQTHFGQDLFVAPFGPLYEPMVRYTLVGLVFWLVCWWMYRQKIFVRI